MAGLAASGTYVIVSVANFGHKLNKMYILKKENEVRIKYKNVRQSDSCPQI